MIFNKDKFLEKVSGLEDLFQEMIIIFLEDTPQNVIDITDAIKKRNALKVYEICHGLKGSAMTICADNLTEICLELESKGQNNDFDNIDKLSDELNQHFNELLNELSKHMEKK